MVDLHEVARRTAVVANILIPVSVFLTVLAWRLSVALFVACWVLYGVAWVLEGGAVRRDLSSQMQR